MHISITGHDEIKSNGFEESVANRLIPTLPRFSRHIDEVDVAITDANDPRGGIDNPCRIRVRISGVDRILATAKAESRWAAVSRAATRARRNIVTKLKQAESQRERFRRNCWNDTGTSDL